MALDQDSFERGLLVGLISRAVTSCSQAGHDPDDHFRQATKMVTVGSALQQAWRAMIDAALKGDGNG